MKKTNAMRELDKNKIKYEFKEYEVDENDLSAIAVSLKTGEDITKIFKTLVLLNEKKEMIVACIPGADTIDLKKLAKIAGAKKVEMLELKELFNMTVLELKEYVNSLSNPEIKEVAEIFEDDEHERDPLELLAAPKLFDYMKYANNGTVDIDLSL